MLKAVVGGGGGATAVTAASVLTANQIVVGDDGARGIKTANATITGSYTFSGQITNALGTITTSQPYTLTQTWNAGGVVFTGALINVTNTASDATSLLVDFQVGGASKFKIRAADGLVTVGVNLSVGGSGTFGADITASSNIKKAAASLDYWTGRAVLTSDVDGSMILQDNNQDDTKRIYYKLGLATSAGAAISKAPSETTLRFVRGDDTDGTKQVYYTWAGQARVATQFDKTSDVALANITGLSVNVAAGKTYTFEAVLYTTSNVGGGVQAAIAGTATATSIIYEGETTAAAAIGAQTRAAALGTTVGGITTVTAARINIAGTITVNGAGTLTVQFAQNTSNGAASSVLVGSSLQVFENPL